MSDNAEFMAELLNREPNPDPLRAALVAIQELHRPVSVYTTEAGCCEHGDECEGIELEQGLFCPDHKDGVTCEGCAEIVQKYGAWDDPPTWPCDTRLLADEALDTGLNTKNGGA